MNKQYEIKASSLTYDENGNILPPRDWFKSTIDSGSMEVLQRAPVIGKNDNVRAHDDL